MNTTIADPNSNRHPLQLAVTALGCSRPAPIVWMPHVICHTNQDVLHDRYCPPVYYTGWPKKTSGTLRNYNGTLPRVYFTERNLLWHICRSVCTVTYL